MLTKPIKIKTALHLKEIRISPLWGASPDKYIPNFMEATVELLPLGLANPKGNHNMRLQIPLTEEIRTLLEKALFLELQDFLIKMGESEE